MTTATTPMTTTMHPSQQMDKVPWHLLFPSMLPTKLLLADSMKTIIKNWSPHWHPATGVYYLRQRLLSWQQPPRRTTTGTTMHATLRDISSSSITLMECRHLLSWHHHLQQRHHHHPLLLPHQQPPLPVILQLIPHLCLHLHIQKQILMLRRSWYNILSR